MSFEEAGTFYKLLVRFCSLEGEDLDESFASLELDLSERYIDYQVTLLESCSGSPPPKSIEDALERIFLHLPELYKAYYVGYLNALRCGDLQLSLTYLQKYFDHSMKESKSTQIQYTSLNMAALYSSLNYTGKALTAIQGGIYYARDQNDQQCLSYLLCWLHQLTFHVNTPRQHFGTQPNEKFMLDSLSNRTESQKQYHLLALCELRKAQYGMESGETLEYTQSCISAAQELIVKHDIGSLEASSWLTMSNGYRFYGDTSRAFHCLTKVLMIGFNGRIPKSLLERSEFKFSESFFLNSELNTTPETSLRSIEIDNSDISKNISALDLSSTLSLLANHFANSGQVVHALSIIVFAKSLFSDKLAREASREWIDALGTILFNCAIESGEYDNAQHTLTQITQMARGCTYAMLNCDLKRSILLQHLGRKLEAIKILERVMQFGDSRGYFRICRIKAMLQLADIHLGRNSVSDVVNAMNVLFSCISVSQQYHLHLWHNLALVRFAMVFLHLNYSKQALNLMQKVMPFILLQADLKEQSKAHYTLSLCWLSLKEKDMDYTKAQHSILESIKGFSQLNSVDGLLRSTIILGHIYELVGNEDKKQLAGKRCLELIQLKERNKTRQTHCWDELV
ncbi:anaphase-promoting complex subunit 5-domain-containing protein, partial [Globomyces pollinis-pini]